MATRQTGIVGRLAVAPSVVALFLWMIVPLGMTIWFSLLRYNLLDPGNESFAGLLNYRYFLTDPAFFQAFIDEFAEIFEGVTKTLPELRLTLEAAAEKLRGLPKVPQASLHYTAVVAKGFKE